ncbi:hypothetical protein C2845_PM15G03830 [Panicum miliaceum]|uniref:Uncharacterized protein n=1 Tax=Panicum miliaceum TaxID=4540 RepID=A0A3L6Q924_PANMI|nr:hypothetical protein C2845_PM15G03830 [Panicum miliaceum]
MRVKRLVTFKMGNKKQASKGKKEESTTGDWERSNCTRADLLNLVAQGLLQTEEMVQWKPSFRQFVPNKKESGVTGVSVMASMYKRRIMPL